MFYHVLVGFPRMKSIALKTSEGTTLYIAIEDGAYCKLRPGMVWGDFSGHSQSYCNKNKPQINSATPADTYYTIY